MARIFRKQIRWKSLIAGGLAVLLLFGAVFGAVKLFGKETRTISPSKWTVGDLDENGAFVSSDTTLVNEVAFACDGLRVEPDFKAENLTYKIFYYDVNDRLLLATDELDSVYEEDHPNAHACRIVIYPDLSEDKNAKISFWEERSYAKQLKVTVNKDQDVYSKVTELVTEGATCSDGTLDADDITAPKTSTTMKVTDLISISGKYDAYRVYIRYTDLPSDSALVAFANCETDDKDPSGHEYNEAICLNNKEQTVPGIAHTFTTDGVEVGVWYSVILEAPAKADTLRVAFDAQAEVRVYGLEK